MNPQDLSHRLLLRQSGELSTEDSAELEAYLQENPEAQALDQEYLVLQDADRFASSELVPPVNDITLERIRSAAQTSTPAPRSQWMAIAAGIVLLLAALPLLIPPESSPINVQEDSFSSTSPFISETEDFSEELEDLQQEIASWNDISTWELLEVEEESYLAEQLLPPVESI